MSEPADIAQAVATPMTPAEVLDTPEAREVLSWMCFQVIPIVTALRASGEEIKKRAEDEQSAALAWMLKFVFSHGAEWRGAAADDLERRAALAAAKAGEGGQADG